jgi:hypothetical protein
MITDKEVNTIAHSIFSAQSSMEQGRVTYLRTLVEATKDELENKKGQEMQAQLAALQRVHERFYEIILAAAQPFVPKTQKDRAIELHRRANFARTALSAVRGHIKADEDIVALNTAKLTKKQLAKAPTPVRAVSPKRLKARAETQSKALVATLLGLADADKAAAVDEIQLILGQLTKQLISMGIKSTKDALESFGEHRPLRIGKTLFIPTASQVLRQEARPS